MIILNIEEKYKEAAEQVSYRDGWCFVEYIGEGYFQPPFTSALSPGESTIDDSRLTDNIEQNKIVVMEDMLNEIINQTDEQWSAQRAQRGYICGSSCRLF